jgi:signal transduction histidine kinase
MRDLPLGFAPLYVAALRGHLRQSGEEGLHQGYELGRRALQEGVGVLDLVALHHDALAGLMLEGRGEEPVEALAPAAEFLAECLSPFEMTLRGYQEANERLGAANVELNQANAAVVSANALLRAEVAERKRAEEALVHAQKLQAVGLLAGGVAHHFNNLLTVVLGNIELARRRIAASTELDGFLLAARRGAQRGAEVARQLLTFSRQQILQPRVVDTSSWLKELTPLLSAALGGHIAVEIGADPSVWPVEVDPSELELTLLNLGVNARDAMPEGGMLRVSAENRVLDDDRLGLRGHFVEISVADTGVGVPPELLKRVFEPFFTTKSLGPGAGLGLSQVHGFVHQSGGRVEMDSVLGHGATVRLYLPAATEQPAAAANDPPPARRAK